MTYDPFYMPDPDEERRRREEEARATATEGAPSGPPPASGVPTQGALASLLQPPDPGMSGQWRQAEQTALGRSGFGQSPSYGAGEAVRDFAPMAVGGVLDILINKGRGLGALAGAGMQANAQEEKNRIQRQNQAGDFALSARHQRESARGQGLQMATEQRQQAMFDLQNNPDNPQAQQFRENLYSRFPSLRGQLDGLTMAQMKQNQAVTNMMAKSDFTPQIAADQGTIAQGRKQGEYRATDEHFPTELDQAGQKSEVQGYASARGGVQAGLDMGAQTRAASAEKIASDARASIAPEVEKRVALDEAGVGTGNGLSGKMDVNLMAQSNPGLKFTNPQLVQEALRTRALTKDVVAQIQAANRGSGVIDEMYKSAQEAQDAMKHGDIERAYAARKQYESHVEEYAGILGKVTGSSSLEQQRRAMELAPSVLNPMALEGIKALWPSIAVNVKGNLGSYGIEARTPAVLGGDKEASPPAAAEAGKPTPKRGGAPSSDFLQGDPARDGYPKRDGSGYDLSDAAELPNTGAPAPKIRLGGGRTQAQTPVGQQAAGGTANAPPSVKPRPDGSFEIDGEVYTADEVAKLRRKGVIQ